jgi:hypothetical protein
VSAAGAFGPGRYGLMPTEGPLAVIEGAIVPCSLVDGHPANAGGTVELPGYEAGVIDPGFGPTTVSQQTVEPNGVYRFVVDPGWYKLESGYGFTSVQVSAGDDVRADLREPCL